MGGAIGLVVYCTHKRVCQTPQKACPQAWTSCAPALTGALMKSTQTGRNRFGRCPERTGQAETSQIPLIAMRPEISAASCGGTHPTTSISRQRVTGTSSRRLQRITVFCGLLDTGISLSIMTTVYAYDRSAAPSDRPCPAISLSTIVMGSSQLRR